MSDRAEMIAAVLAEHAPHNGWTGDQVVCKCTWVARSVEGKAIVWHRAHVAAALDRALPRYEQVGYMVTNDYGSTYFMWPHQAVDVGFKRVPVFRELPPEEPPDDGSADFWGVLR